MKKIIVVALVLCSLVLSGSCTNNEGSSDLDIITPNDSTQGEIQTADLTV